MLETLTHENFKFDHCCQIKVPQIVVFWSNCEIEIPQDIVQAVLQK